ncbi:MAG: hypothetical protein RTU30_07830 [Candidatus Thorarchaeota archaeon]
MRVTPDRIGKFDGKTCFICGKYLLNYTSNDMAWLLLPAGNKQKAKPDKYFLFSCPNCKEMGHKRCWYDFGEIKKRKGWFGSQYTLHCPSCGQRLSESRENREDWKRGYQLPGHVDGELIELHVSDVLAWKAGSIFGKIGRAIDNFFKAVGLGSLTDPERNAVAKAAAKIGKTIQDVAQRVFKLNIPAEQRKELEELKCQNCGAPLPLPEPYEEAVVCEHCGTAHLLPV